MIPWLLRQHASDCICYDHQQMLMEDASMTDSRQPAPDSKKEKSNKIKRRLIWLGITLAILAALEIGDLIMRIAKPRF
jgi:hypothetical protein